MSDALLTVGQWQRNIEYYRLCDNANLLAKHKEANDIWFRLVMDDNNKNYTSDNLTTIAFWQHVMECTEQVLNERNIIF